MSGHDPVSLFLVILLANVATTAVTITAAIKRPIVSYKIIAALAGCAAIASLQQATSRQFNLLSLLLNTALVLSIALRGVLNQRRRRNR